MVAQNSSAVVISFRLLRAADFPLLSEWQAAPHVAAWWRDPSDLASVTAEYRAIVDGEDPTEVFIITLDGRDVGLIQRYRIDDYPEWGGAVGIANAVGIDYYLGDVAATGRGVGSAAIARFSDEALERYPDATAVVAVPQQANVASWRALEKAGFERAWAGTLESEDPSDSGPAYVYVLWRGARVAG